MTVVEIDFCLTGVDTYCYVGGDYIRFVRRGVSNVFNAATEALAPDIPPLVWWPVAIVKSRYYATCDIRTDNYRVKVEAFDLRGDGGTRFELEYLGPALPRRSLRLKNLKTC
jgi:hypothetical protein